MHRLLFSKTGDAVFLSHLDMMRIFQRAFQRAGILIWHSQGFTPRAYVSIALPLSVGTESVCEILEFDIQDGTVDLATLPDRLNRTMPRGVCVLQAYESDRKVKQLTYLRAEVVLEYDSGVPRSAQQAIGELFSREIIEITKHGKRGDKVMNIKEQIRSMVLRQLSPQELAVETVVCAQNPGLNPQLLVSAIETYLPGMKPDFARIARKEIYDEQMRIFR